MQGQGQSASRVYTLCETTRPLPKDIVLFLSTCKVQIINLILAHLKNQKEDMTQCNKIQKCIEHHF